MRIAFALKQRRCLMPLDPSRLVTSSSSSSPLSLSLPSASSSHLKRSFSRQATATQPAKAPRIEGSESPHVSSSNPRSKTIRAPEFGLTMPSTSGTPSSHRHRGPSSASSRFHSQRGGRGGGPSRGGGSTHNSSTRRNLGLDEPKQDKAYIFKHHRSDIKKIHEENPKSSISNWFMNQLGQSPDYPSKQILLRDHPNKIWRATLTVPLEDGEIIAIGDDESRKEAEKLAALSAVYQLQSRNMLDIAKKPSATNEVTATQTVRLSDGSDVGYERARQFMDYYCRRYKFGSPDISFSTVGGGSGGRRGNASWEASMTVGGRRIGMGAASTKKGAQIACYLDVTKYLEECDPELWKTFVEAAKTGKDLGPAPKVYFQMSERLEDEIRDLCTDIRRSTLYRNRPKIGSAKTGSDSADAEDGENKKPVPPVASRQFRAANPATLEKKNADLSVRQKKYLEDPAMQKMRDTRFALPVHTRADDLLKHVRENEVTICMAATGSGKTTQIPQMILDDAIARGEGASCNIVCTQPRRIAAISVADRVAKERGETVGRGTVGYQVRFEAKLPEDHGSITFCTTGIFLKRLQSAMSDESASGFKGLDDVSHVVVDEVHERDIDTDLLLVVLKRLLAERKARNKPIKIILMSATIDPTLFQQYFPDEQGKPSGVLEIPGRSFPVTKHFMEDYIEQIRTPETAWVWKERAVINYIHNELGSAVAQNYVGSPMKASSDSNVMLDDLDIPHALTALIISHVLQKTADGDGHVLVFLPGWDDIVALQRMLTEGRFGIDFADKSKYAIHLLHSTVPLAEQQQIFEPPPEGVRRIILSTNIAETSVTIPDVVYVVDTAKIKEQRYDPERHMSALVTAWVGSSNLHQRAGRAGRHRSGEYFGLLGKRRMDALHPYQTVEMKRVDLSNVVMHVKALNFPGMSVEEVLTQAIEPPAAGRIEAAMNDLKMVGALDVDKNLTALGRVLLQLPVEAQMGRLVLFGSFFRCLDSALTLAAILTNRDPFVSPMHLKQEAAAKKASWTPANFRSDALATLFAYNAWWKLQGEQRYQQANQFCSENFLSKPTLLMIQKIKAQLLQSLYAAGVIEVSAGGSIMPLNTRWRERERDREVPAELNRNGDSLPLLAALIAIATQPKFAIRTSEKMYRTAQDKSTFIHPSSVNHRKKEMPENGMLQEKQLYAFAEKRQNVSTGTSGQTFLVTTTRLDPMTYVLFGAYKLETVEKGLECDGWLPIVGNLDALDDIARLKTLMESSMLRVFEGITMRRRFSRGRPLPVLPREEESESEDEEIKDYSLSPTEIKELDLMTRDIVRILNRYSDERLETQSRANSRPATPMGSPAFQSLRLPGSNYGGSSTSGYNTPYSFSRPGTPSRLGRRIG